MVQKTYTCDICSKKSSNAEEYNSNSYSVLYVGSIYERGLSPVELPQFEKVILDLCSECFKKSLDEVIKRKRVAYSNKSIYGFWKYDDIKFN